LKVACSCLEPGSIRDPSEVSTRGRLFPAPLSDVGVGDVRQGGKKDDEDDSEKLYDVILMERGEEIEAPL
jgi:hypothetical protein